MFVEHNGNNESTEITWRSIPKHIKDQTPEMVIQFCKQQQKTINNLKNQLEQEKISNISLRSLINQLEYQQQSEYERVCNFLELKISKNPILENLKDPVSKNIIMKTVILLNDNNSCGHLMDASTAIKLTMLNDLHCPICRFSFKSYKRIFALDQIIQGLLNGGKLEHSWTLSLKKLLSYLVFK